MPPRPCYTLTATRPSLRIVRVPLRIVRVQTQEVVSDRCTLHEHPSVIALDEEERPTHGGENGPDNEDHGPKTCFSDVSSDSDTRLKSAETVLLMRAQSSPPPPPLSHVLFLCSLLAPLILETCRLRGDSGSGS